MISCSILTIFIKIWKSVNQGNMTKKRYYVIMLQLIYENKSGNGLTE